jgi:hypothetical protein
MSSDFLDKLKSAKVDTQASLGETKAEKDAYQAKRDKEAEATAQLQDIINARFRQAAAFLIDNDSEPGYFFGLSGAVDLEARSVFGMGKKQGKINKFKEVAKKGWVFSGGIQDWEKATDSHGHVDFRGHGGVGLLTDGAVVKWQYADFHSEAAVARNLLSAEVVPKPFSRDFTSHNVLSPLFRPEAWIQEKEEIIARWTGLVLLGKREGNNIRP